MLIGLGLGLGCADGSVGERGHESATSAPLTGIDVPGFPPSAVRVVIERGSGSAARCMGTVVHGRWVLLAAHCFGHTQDLDLGAPGDGGPGEILIRAGRPGVSDVSVAAEGNVFFHPDAVPGKPMDVWNQPFSAEGEVDCAHDLAMVRFGEPLKTPPAKLYHADCPPSSPPGSPCDGKFAGIAVQVGGYLAGQPGTASNITRPWVSATHFKGGSCGASTGAPMLVIDFDGGFLPTPGDSGSGLFASAPTPSLFPLLTFCAEIAPPPDKGETALLGVTSVLRSTSDGVPVEVGVVPTFLPEHGEWIVQKILYGQDNDPICDDFDDCPNTPEYVQCRSGRQLELSGRAGVGESEHRPGTAAGRVRSGTGSRGPARQEEADPGLRKRRPDDQGPPLRRAGLEGRRPRGRFRSAVLLPVPEWRWNGNHERDAVRRSTVSLPASSGASSVHRGADSR